VGSIDGTNKVFIVDLVRRVTTPLVLGKRRVESVRWHPDGKRLTLGGDYLSLFDPDTGSETRLTPTGRPKRFASWARDGRSVAYMTFEPANDIYVLTLNEDGAPAGAPRPLRATDGTKFSPAISPDGGWIAYRHPATGRTDVYVAHFPEGTKRVQISDKGAGTPFWSHKQDEVLFTAPPGVMQSVAITRGERVQVGTPRTLFTVGVSRFIFSRAGWQPVPGDQAAEHPTPAEHRDRSALARRAATHPSPQESRVTPASD
jgi:hypothetical protein